MTGTGVLALANAAAGSARRRQVADVMSALRAAADGRCGPVELVSTRGPHRLADALARLGGRRLVVLGGDGSVQAALQALHDAGRLAEAGPIGIVPLGTGNDLARSLGLPADPVAAARTALGDAHRPMDLLVAQDGVVAANAVHVGIGASAARTAARIKPALRTVGLGRLAYPMGAVVAGATERGWRLQVELDGTVLQDATERLLMVALGLGGTVGGGAPLLPGADPGDAVMDVVVWRAVGPVGRLRFATQVRRGAHVERPDVLRTRGRALTVRALPGEVFPADGDGELLGPFTVRSWRVEPGAWRAVVPAGPATGRAEAGA